MYVIAKYKNIFDKSESLSAKPPPPSQSKRKKYKENRLQITIVEYPVAITCLLTTSLFVDTKFYMKILAFTHDSTFSKSFDMSEIAKGLVDV